MKGSKIYIHIGMHKTGTTFLQNQVFKNLNEIHYINGGLLNEICRPSNRSEQSKLISWEGLSGRPYIGQPTKENKSLKKKIYRDSFYASVNNLKRLFPNCEIIIFIRKHEEYIVSWYRHFIKRGGVLTFKEFYGEKGVLHPSDILYKKKIQVLKENFKVVHIFDYSDLKNKPDETIMKLLSIIDEKDFNDKISSKKVNVSIKGWRLNFVRRYNSIFFKFPSQIQRILKLIYLSPELFVTKLLFFIGENETDKDDYNIKKIALEFKSDWDYIQHIKIKI